MKNKKQNIILEDQQDDFLFKKTKSNLNISFNRISFIFFVFFVIFLPISLVKSICDSDSVVPMLFTEATFSAISMLYN